MLRSIGAVSYPFQQPALSLGLYALVMCKSPQRVAKQHPARSCKFCHTFCFPTEFVKPYANNIMTPILLGHLSSVVFDSANQKGVQNM